MVKTVQEMQSWLKEQGWSTPKVLQESLDWYTQLVDESTLILHTDEEAAIYTRNEEGWPLNDVQLRYMAPLGVNLSFGELWLALNRFYSRTPSIDEMRAIGILERGNASPAMQAECARRMPAILNPAMQVVLSDWMETL
jgi:predicted metal-dependent enzyme (double-stranded beta helix superfamily)